MLSTEEGKESYGGWYLLIPYREYRVWTGKDEKKVLALMGPMSALKETCLFNFISSLFYFIAVHGSNSGGLGYLCSFPFPMSPRLNVSFCVLTELYLFGFHPNFKNKMQISYRSTVKEVQY
ncbi:hypothetical protein CR513_14079, partial [Mucuna pruriens]